MKDLLPKTANFFVTFDQHKIRLIQILKEFSYEKREVVLASGQKSDFYIDCRQTSLHPEGAVLIGELFLERILSLPAEVHAVGGPTLGADPLVTAVAYASHLKQRPLPAFIIRKEPKKHGTGQWIEGAKGIRSGSRVVILEDVVTSGGSSLTAAQKAEEFGFEVYGILTLVDRQQGGAEKIREAGYFFDALVTRAEIEK